MSNRFRQPQNLGCARFSLVMARPAQCNKVVECIRLGNTPWDDMMHVKFLFFPRKRTLLFPASTANITVTTSRNFRKLFPIFPAFVVPRTSALPVGVIGTDFSYDPRRYITILRAKSFRPGIKAAKNFAAKITLFLLRPFTIPSFLMIAGHITKTPSFRLISKSFKNGPAIFASLFNTRSRLSMTYFFSFIPSWATVCSGTIARTILSTTSASKKLVTLSTMMLNWIHVCIINHFLNINKYFDIACQRIEEAYRQPDMLIEQSAKKPEQDSFL